jgi:hypothetical protein
MALRRGRTQSILSGSIDSALLAVEVFNKPRASFRTQNYILLMILAWTKLFHAHFHRNIGNRFYYKKQNNRYEIIDGERKAWELKTCIRRYGKLSEAVTTNLDLFIKLRNKIEHRHIDKREFDLLIFGECQALLYNYETLLTELFGEEYGISENLTYSLQFSTLRDPNQQKSTKRALSADIADIKAFVEMFRSQISQSVFDSAEYSIKLIQIPKIANASRNDLAIEFVNWNALSDEDKANFKKLDAIVKNKIVKLPVVNLGGMKPGKVLKTVESKASVKLSHHDHRCLCAIFRIRPDGGGRDPFDTRPEYCHYDEVHDDYVYYEAWVDKLVQLLKAGKMKKVIWKQAHKRGDTHYKVEDYV